MAPDELLVHYIRKTIYPNTPTMITNAATNPKVTLSCSSLLIILICIFNNFTSQINIVDSRYKIRLTMLH
jgi:hypothetical protein